MATSSRVILLTGAPPPASIDEASCTISAFSHPFSSYLDGHHHAVRGADRNHQQPPPSSPPRTVAAWRVLPLRKDSLHTSFLFSQAHALGITGDHGTAPPRSHPHFFTTADVSLVDGSSLAGDDSHLQDAEDALTQFCEQSLAEHDAAPSSSVLSQSFDTSIVTDTSFATESSAGGAPGTVPPPPIPAHLSDLEDIPPAPQVLAFSPQTITLNLIVGVLSVAQPRTVTTRWGTTLALVEVLVGDETSAGFGVTFWLPGGGGGDAAAAQVAALRRQDVVLMRSVALRVFRGKVYGQSLRGGRTKLSLLWRRDGSGHYSTRDLHPKKTQNVPQLEKTRHVKDWLLKFVGASSGDRTKPGVKSWDNPPDDTQ